MENEAHNNPGNLQNLLTLASLYLQMQQTNRTIELFNRVMADPHLSSSMAGFIAQTYAKMGNLAKLEEVLRKIVVLVPDHPEPWYDLAALDTILGRPDLAFKTCTSRLTSAPSG